MAPNDMSKITGMSTDDILSDQLGTSKRFAGEWDHVVILTGIPNIIVASDGQATIIPKTTPALSKAGADYILVGIIAGLRAQGIDPYPAAIAGTWIFVMAGKAAGDRLGGAASVLASDILSAVPEVIRNLQLGKR
jgi:NAD(P)H-hydrate epimerase